MVLALCQQHQRHIQRQRHTHKDKYKDKDEDNDIDNVLQRPITCYIFETLGVQGYRIRRLQ